MIPYCGDEKFSKTLASVGSPFSIAEVKAYIMGVIAATQLAPMQVVHDHLFGGTAPKFGNKSQADDFFANLTGLWNNMADHQNVDNPFRFSNLNIDADGESIQTALSARVAEIKQFIKGLDAGGTNPNEFSVNGWHSFRHLAQVDVIFKNIIKVFKTDKTASEETVNDLIDNLKKIDGAIHDCVHQIILEAQKIRFKQLGRLPAQSVPKEKVQQAGRNDLCPCGSGIKFKKCCLPKMQ